MLCPDEHPMATTIHLLGNPRIERTSGSPYQVRSRKSWALLAYLLLRDRPPARAQLAELLFSEADDPLRALRWNLSEVRRVLGDEATVTGDPVEVRLPPDTVVDVHVVTRGGWAEAVRLPGLGRELLEAFHVRAGAAFESWLLTEQRHVAAASEAVLHEAANALASLGRLEEAVAHAELAASSNPLEEDHQALLIRLYGLLGDNRAATRQYELCREVFARELGRPPGPAVTAALAQRPRGPAIATDLATVRATIEAGTAAIAAGAVRAGIDSLHTAVQMTDGGADAELRVRARLRLADALIHALGGLDGEGRRVLHEADEIARGAGDRSGVAVVRAELGYVDFLRGRYDRAEVWLRRARADGDGDLRVEARSSTYLGAVQSDRGDYPAALAHLTEALELARRIPDPHLEAYGEAMLGRIHLLRGALDEAAGHLTRSTDIAEQDHWLGFLPWPQSLLGEVQLEAGDLAAAEATFGQAFARACNLGDPCWEGVSARGVALVTAARGDTTAAFSGLLDARARCNRHSDAYVWLDAHILDAMCELGLQHEHASTADWVAQLRTVASRCGMRELTVRSLLHGAGLGEPGAARAAALLSGDVDNPALRGRIPEDRPAPTTVTS